MPAVRTGIGGWDDIRNSLVLTRSNAVGTTAVPMPLLRRRERFLGTFALSLSVAAVTLGSAPVGAWAGTVATVRRTAIVEAVDKTQSCVVNISSEKKAASNSRWPFTAEENQRPRVSGMGSGVILDCRGYILTNHHVVDKVQGIEVQLSDGTTYPARVLQYDPVMDLAMLKIDADHGRCRRSTIGTSSDLMVGETVITIGNAFGYENTVSVGNRQRPASRRHALRRPGLPQPDPDRRLHQPGQLGGSADQHRRRADRHQRRGSRRGAGDRVRLADRRGQAGRRRDDEHPPAGLDLAWPGGRRTARGTQRTVVVTRGAAGKSGVPRRASRPATNWCGSAIWPSPACSTWNEAYSNLTLADRRT